VPTSLETLVRYRAAHADYCESRRVWLFHSDTYFDHTTRALWLGTPLAIDRTTLEAVDAKLPAFGGTEESIIDGTKKH